LIYDALRRKVSKACCIFYLIHGKQKENNHRKNDLMRANIFLTPLMNCLSSCIFLADSKSSSSNKHLDQGLRMKNSPSAKVFYPYFFDVYFYQHHLSFLIYKTAMRLKIFLLISTLQHF